jgi:hypothetical protein
MLAGTPTLAAVYNPHSAKICERNSFALSILNATFHCIPLANWLIIKLAKLFSRLSYQPST